MKVEFTMDRDSTGRVTHVLYTNDRTIDPDGRNQIEILEFLSLVETGKPPKSPEQE